MYYDWRKNENTSTPSGYSYGCLHQQRKMNEESVKWDVPLVVYIFKNQSKNRLQNRQSEQK